jgi:1-acyl-sn-glycerol-3-phosphate acyltransferase
MPDDVRLIRRSRWLRPVLYHVGGPMCRRLFRLRVEGEEHLPAAGAAIIAANHLSFFDSVVLALAVPRPLRFVGKAEYLDHWPTRRLFPALGMIPVERRSPRQAYGALRAAAQVLEADELFAVYPEGTRSHDGTLQEGHNGVGHLSVTTGASIIPAGIVGTDRIQPKGTRVPRPFRPATVRFGSPIDPHRYDGSRRECRRRITRDVMSAIGELSGQTATGAPLTGRSALPG